MKLNFTKEALYIKALLNIERNDFVGIYSIDYNRPYLDRHFFILHKIESVSQLLELRRYYKNFDGYMGYKDYRIDKEFYVCYTFEIPGSFQDEYEYFLENKHSKIREVTKQVIDIYWKKYNIETRSLFLNDFEPSYVQHSDFIYNNFDKLEENENVRILDVECVIAEI